ncbi:hypothetical protein AYI70_g9996 [Smittium culicis]|uniref:Uncharacterized protein n=1 Tax=Smittium culicis TaxID=133412 RepID=A0A1R1X8M0_9FUNG|nr:hypothetical protein AYI70_g9996 [Smittium culicis]
MPISAHKSRFIQQYGSQSISTLLCERQVDYLHEPQQIQKDVLHGNGFDFMTSSIFNLLAYLIQCLRGSFGRYINLTSFRA